MPLYIQANTAAVTTVWTSWATWKQKGPVQGTESWWEQTAPLPVLPSLCKQCRLHVTCMRGILRRGTAGSSH